MKRALFLALALAGCMTPQSRSGDRPARLAGRCDAGPAQQYLGRFGSPEIAGEARDVAGATRVRWLWPGTVTTMEYDPGRIDIVLTQQRIIHAIRCG